MFGPDAIKGLLEQVGSLTDGMDLPSVFKEEFELEFANIDPSQRHQRRQEDPDPIEVLPQWKVKKPRGYEPREYIKRTPKEESSWYSRYLAADKRNSIRLGETDLNASPSDKKLAGQFKTTFRVYWEVFEQVRDLIVDKKFHDPSKKDAVGFAHDIELLLLGRILWLSTW